MLIKDMSTKAIIWHLLKRHAVMLLIFSNVMTVTLYTVVHFNRSWQAFIK